MNELWIKKTVLRRYLIEDEDMKEVESVIKGEPDRAGFLIEEFYDKNKKTEYDQEETVLPLIYKRY